MNEPRIIRYVKFGTPEMAHCTREDDYQTLLESIKVADGVTEYAVFGAIESMVKVARWEPVT